MNREEALRVGNLFKEDRRNKHIVLPTRKYNPDIIFYDHEIHFLGHHTEYGDLYFLVSNHGKMYDLFLVKNGNGCYDYNTVHTPEFYATAEERREQLSYIKILEWANLVFNLTLKKNLYRGTLS